MVFEYEKWKLAKSQSTHQNIHRWKCNKSHKTSQKIFTHKHTQIERILIAYFWGATTFCVFFSSFFQFYCDSWSPLEEPQPQFDKNMKMSTNIQMESVRLWHVYTPQVENISFSESKNVLQYLWATQGKRRRAQNAHLNIFTRSQLCFFFVQVFGGFLRTCIYRKTDGIKNKF